MPAAPPTEPLSRVPAVSLSIAKRPGTNATQIARAVQDRLAAVSGRMVPAGVEMTVTRNYGESADEKANELLAHLGLATVAIVLLVGGRHRLARGAGGDGGDPRHHPAHPLRLPAHGATR